MLWTVVEGDRFVGTLAGRFSDGGDFFCFFWTAIYLV
jgi:hypothetical protein